jgi:hypothetical protein
LPELWLLLAGVELADLLDKVCWQEGQDVAEYAVMVAVISGDRDWHDPLDWLPGGQCNRQRRQLDSIVKSWQHV